jgi:hypothetical protein
MREGRTILPGFISSSGSNRSLISLEGRASARPNCHATHSSAPAVAVLAREGALVLAHHARGFLGDRAHLLAPPRRMSRIGRTCSVPTEAWAYQVPRCRACANTSVRRRVFGQVLERHRAVLDEGDRLAVALHRHHDVEAGLADLPECLLLLWRRSSRPRCRAAEVGHQLDQALQARSSGLASSPANSTSRIASGWPIRAASITGRKAGLSRARSIIVRSTSSTALGAQLHDVLGAVHRLIEAREVHHAQRLVLGQRREPERSRRSK